MFFDKKIIMYFLLLLIPLSIQSSEHALDLPTTFSYDLTRDCLFPLLPETIPSLKLVCSHFFNADCMPESLRTKIFKKNMARQCGFLLSVYEGDKEAVKWILEHDKTYKREKPVLPGNPQNSYPYVSDRYYYYSLCAKEQHSSILTPCMVAQHNNNHDMLNLLHYYFPNHINEQRIEHTPYDLFMNVCSKPDSYSNSKAQITTCVHPDYQHHDDYKISVAKKTQAVWIKTILLIAHVNNDETLKKLVEKHPSYDENFIFDFIGVGYGYSLFVTDKEIKSLFNHPWFKKDKQKYIQKIEKLIEERDLSNFMMIYENETKMNHYKRILALLKEDAPAGQTMPSMSLAKKFSKTFGGRTR